MNLNRIIKGAVAAALLSAVSIPALATSITPPSSGPVPVPGLTNGGVVVEVYDLTTGMALSEWLGGDVSTFGAPSSVPASGETLDYGVLGGSEFATLFPSAQITAGNVVFTVSAANDVNAAAPIMDLTVSSATGSLLLNKLESIASANGSAINTILNGASPACADANPCIATSATAGTWAVSDLGASLGGLPNTIDAAGVAGGTALNFYQVVGTGTALTKQTLVQFANSTGDATWTLSASGDLQFNAPAPATVPLPAAVWLFGSGLLGLAGIGRRKLMAA